MRKSRLVGFIIAIVVGIAAGLIYGWVINPAGVKNTSLKSLRNDYKADYVLMVAECYASDGDLAGAVERLKAISTSDAVSVVQQGLITAQQLGYSNLELQYMAELEKALTMSGVGNQ